MLCPVAGSTAAYSHSRSYRSWTSQGGRTPRGHHRLRNPTRNPKRPSSKAHTRWTPVVARVAAKPRAKRLLRRRIGQFVAPPSGLELDAVLAQLLPDPVQTGVDDAVLLGQVVLGLFEGGDLSGGHRCFQVGQRIRGEAGGLARIGRLAQQSRQSRLAIERPPARHLARAVSDQAGAPLQTVRYPTLQQSQGLHADGGGTPAHLPLHPAQRRLVLCDLEGIVRSHRGTPSSSPSP